MQMDRCRHGGATPDGLLEDFFTLREVPSYFLKPTFCVLTFPGFEEVFIVKMALNDGLHMQKDKLPSYQGRTVSFIKPMIIYQQWSRIFAGLCDTVCVIGNVANWVTLLAILRHSRASPIGKPLWQSSGMALRRSPDEILNVLVL